jgi:hypothetical protein
MKYIIALFLAVGILTAGDTKPHLHKCCVSGGNKNATLGQVVAGYKNKFHIGIRIPKRLALSVEETKNVDGLVYPNPCYGVATVGMDNVKSIQVSDLYGKFLTEGIDVSTRTITFTNRGVYIVRVTTNSNVTYSTTIIY